MKETLITILESFGYPVRLQGSLLPDEPYPPSFFTFWNNSSSDGAHYDNSAISYVWSFDINFYSNDPALVNTVLLSAKASLVAAGWIIDGKGYDVPTDEPSHTGRGIVALYLEQEHEPEPTPTPEPESGSNHTQDTENEQEGNNDDN